jgi:hypothetical protein
VFVSDTHEFESICNENIILTTFVGCSHYLFEFGFSYLFLWTCHESWTRHSVHKHVQISDGIWTKLEQVDFMFKKENNLDWKHWSKLSLGHEFFEWHPRVISVYVLTKVRWRGYVVCTTSYILSGPCPQSNTWVTVATSAGRPVTVLTGGRGWWVWESEGKRKNENPDVRSPPSFVSYEDTVPSTVFTSDGCGNRWEKRKNENPSVRVPRSWMFVCFIATWKLIVGQAPRLCNLSSKS